MSPDEAERRVERTGIVPVVTLPDPDHAVPLCRALLRGGVDVVEITFRVRGAAEAISTIRDAVPEMLVGAGTLTTPEQVGAAARAGAHFGVAPGLNSRVVGAALEANLAFWPGVCTPSEVEAALALGAQVLKFFPAEAAGGVDMVRVLLAPYRHLGVRFVPTGGIDAEGARAYWATQGVVAVGGSWLTPVQDIAEERWADIAALARAAVESCGRAREQG